MSEAATYIIDKVLLCWILLSVFVSPDT